MSELTLTPATVGQLGGGPAEIVHGLDIGGDLKIGGGSPWFDVTHDLFGATGDGATDDTAAIQAAIDACEAAGGGVMYFPPGDYKVTSTLTVPQPTSALKGMKIQGAARGSTVLVYSGTGYCIQIGEGDEAGFGALCHIHDLFIDMSASAVPTGAVNFLVAQFSGLERVRIVGPTGGSKILVNFDPDTGTAPNYYNYIKHCALKGQTQASDILVKLLSSSGAGANSNKVYDNHFNTALQAVLIDGGDGNIVRGNEFNGSITTGVKLQGTAVGNKILDNQFDGPTTDIDVSASTVSDTILGFNTGTLTIVDSGTNTIRIDASGGLIRRTKSIWLPAQAFTLRSGSPALAAQGTNLQYLAWAFDAATTEMIVGALELPADYLAGGALVFKLYWTNLGAGSGDVRWRISWIDKADAADLNGAGATNYDTTLTAPAQNILKVSTHGATPTGSANLASLLIQRLGAEGVDTLGNDAGLLGVMVEYTADWR